MPGDLITERKGKMELNAKIAEIERVLLAVVRAIKELENEEGFEVMPAGEYYGHKFE